MSGYLDSVREQLVERTEQRAGAGLPHPPQRRGSGRRRAGELAAAAAVLLIAAVVATLVLSIGSGRGPHRPAGLHLSHRAIQRHRHRPPPTRPRLTKSSRGSATTPPLSGSPAGPVPTGFSPESFTAIGEFTWWLLGSAPCASPPCTSIVRTEDGGRTFVGIPAPRTSQVDELRFADARDGFAFGPQLWVTHDAGASWSHVRLGGQVSSLEASGGYVYAIVRAASGASGRLMRSAVGSDSWTALPAAGDAFGGLWVQGSNVLLEASSNTAQWLEVSHDDGQTFARDPIPPSVACQFTAPQPPVLWEHCATGMLSGDWISGDGGASYRPASGHGLPELPNSAAFAAASATTAVSGFQRLYRTSDAGASWTPVAGAPALDWSYLGFTDPTHGVAIGNPLRSSRSLLYYTTDGGLSYHLVVIG